MLLLLEVSHRCDRKIDLMSFSRENSTKLIGGIRLIRHANENWVRIKNISSTEQTDCPR